MPAVCVLLDWHGLALDGLDGFLWELTKMAQDRGWVQRQALARVELETGATDVSFITADANTSFVRPVCGRNTVCVVGDETWRQSPHRQHSSAIHLRQTGRQLKRRRHALCGRDLLV